MFTSSDDDFLPVAAVGSIRSQRRSGWELYPELVVPNVHFMSPAFQNGWFSDSGLRQERMPHMYIYCINSARTRLSGLGSTLDTSDQSQIKLRKKLCHHHCSGWLYIRLNAVGCEWLWRALLPAGFTRVVCRFKRTGWTLFLHCRVGENDLLDAWKMILWHF